MAVTETSVRVGPLLIETAAMTKDGEEVSGDRACVGHTDAGVLVGVIDGLGHGADAGAAAHRAGDVPLRSATLPLSAGDTLVFATDDALLLTARYGMPA
jgi:hypothetical protein